MLHVIRHGRASALEANYDQLHAIGELQARALGAHLGRERQHFDAVYVGPLTRQLETQRLMREAAGEVGRAWPEAQVLEDLAEGPFETLFKRYVRVLAKTDPVMQQHIATYRAAADEAAKEQASEALFAHVIERWRRAEVSGEDLETAAAFDARVVRVLGQIAAREGRGRQVAVVTSNGVIANLVMQTRGFVVPADHHHRRVHNSSISRIELVEGGYELRAHNVTLHLSDPAHLTTL